MLGMNQALFKICEHQKLTRLESVLMVLVVTLLAVYIAGAMGLFTLAGCIGFVIRNLAEVGKKEIKKEEADRNRIHSSLNLVGLLAGAAAATTVVAATMLQTVYKAAQADAQARPIPTPPVLTARLLITPIAA